MAMPKYDTVAEYVATLGDEGLAAFEAVRSIATDLCPGFEERVSYGLPTIFVGGKRIIHIAAWDKHLALYPSPPEPDDDPTLVADLQPNIKGKGTLHFPYAAGLPTDLIRRVLRAHLVRAGQWHA